MRRLFKEQAAFTCASASGSPMAGRVGCSFPGKPSGGPDGRVTLVRGQAHGLDEPAMPAVTPELPFAMADFFLRRGCRD